MTPATVATDLRAAVAELRRQIRDRAGVMRRGDPNTTTTCGSCRTGEPCGGECDLDGGQS